MAGRKSAPKNSAGFGRPWRIMSVADKTMKMIKTISALTLSAVVLAAPFAGLGAEQPGKSAAPLKPDKLTTCPVSGDKLGEMGKAYVFEYKGQQVKLCCKDCLKDFKKNPAKYVKKIREADNQIPAKPDAKK